MTGDEIQVPPVSVQLQIAEAAVELQQIAYREAVLGRAVTKNAGNLLDADIEALAAMALKLDEQMAVAERHTDFLRRAFEQYGPWFDQQVSYALTADHFQPDQLEQLKATLDVQGDDYSSLGSALAGSAPQAIPGSRAQLRDSAFDFKGKVAPAMDWHHVGCTMIDLSILGGLATCIPTEGAGCAVALAGTIAHAALCS